jgi:hypothetical protein
VLPADHPSNTGADTRQAGPMAQAQARKDAGAPEQPPGNDEGDDLDDAHTESDLAGPDEAVGIVNGKLTVGPNIVVNVAAISHAARYPNGVVRLNFIGTAPLRFVGKTAERVAAKVWA